MQLMHRVLCMSNELKKKNFFLLRIVSKVARPAAGEVASQEKLALTFVS